MRWNPAGNGWWPQLSADGNYVAYGTGSVWVTNLSTLKVEFSVGPNIYIPRWIRPDTLTYVRFDDSHKGYGWRYEVKIGEWQAKLVDEGPQYDLSDFDAANGHWLGVTAGKRAYIDGQVVFTGGAFTAACAGD